MHAFSIITCFHYYYYYYVYDYCYYSINKCMYNLINDDINIIINLEVFRIDRIRIAAVRVDGKIRTF